MDGRRELIGGLVGMGGVAPEDGSGVVHPLGIPGVVVLEPEDEIVVFSVLLDEEKPLLEILET